MRARQLLPVLAGLALPACGQGGPLDPGDVEHVSIQLAVSGGLVGQDYSFVVDGGSLEVRGLECASFCGFEEGEVILPISTELVFHLATRLEEAGVFDLGGDHGSPCCDQIDYDLIYVVGDRDVRVQAGGEQIPASLVDLIGDLVSLSRGEAPAMVDRLARRAEWPADPYSIGRAVVDGLRLDVAVQYGGGCRPHAMDLVIAGEWTSTDPPEVDAFVSHAARDDSCEALISETRAFDLGPVARAARGGMGQPSPGTVILRLWDPVAGNSSERRLRVDY